MKFILTFLVCTIYLNCNGQNYFSKSIEIVPLSNDQGWGLLLDSDGFIITTASRCLNDNIGCTGILKTDFEGNKQWTKLYDSNPHFMLPAIGGSIKLMDDFIICGNSGMMGNQYFLMKINNDGDSLWLNHFGNDLIDRSRTVRQQIDGGFLIYGDRGIYNEFSDILLIKANENGIIEWEKIVEDTMRFAQQGNIEILSDGNLIMTNRTIPWNPPFDNSVTVSKITPLGEPIWSKTYHPNNLDDKPSPKIKELHNGNLVLRWARDTFHLLDYYHSNIIIGLDSMGSILWEHHFNDPLHSRWSNIIVADNGDIIGCGTYFDEGDNMGWLFRMTEEGELLWERRFGGLFHQNASYSLIDLKETSNGDIVAVGTKTDTLSSWLELKTNVWLLKVDANGCLNPGCDEDLVLVSTEEINIEENKEWFSISPNPSNGLFNIKFSNPISQEGDEFIFLNANGQEVKKESIKQGLSELWLDIHDSPSGVYFLLLKRNGVILQQEKVVITH